MNQQPDGQYTLPVSREAVEWLQEFGGYSSVNDIIMMLLRFYDAYRVDHKSTRDDLNRILQSALPDSAETSCVKVMEKIYDLKPSTISFTIRERLTGMMLPHERKVILTLYVHHVPFCLAYLSREENGMVSLYIPDQVSRYSPTNEPGFIDDHIHFSGWRGVATISGDDAIDHDEIIQPIRDALNKVYRTSGAPTKLPFSNEMVEVQSQKKEKQFRFWKDLIDRINRKKLALFSKCTPKGEGRLVAGGGFTGTVYTYALQNNSVIVSFRISKEKKKEQMKISGLFTKLMESREEIEGAFGGPLEWISDETKRFDYIRIILRNGGLSHEEQWAEIQDEMVETMERLKDAVAPVMVKIVENGMS